jgi:hypothetical protein
MSSLIDQKSKYRAKSIVLRPKAILGRTLGASLVWFRVAELLPTTHIGAGARPINGVWNRAQMGPNRVSSTHLWSRL